MVPLIEARERGPPAANRPRPGGTQRCGRGDERATPPSRAWIPVPARCPGSSGTLPAFYAAFAAFVILITSAFGLFAAISGIAAGWLTVAR